MGWLSELPRFVTTTGKGRSRPKRQGTNTNNHLQEVREKELRLQVR